MGPKMPWIGFDSPEGGGVSSRPYLVYGKANGQRSQFTREARPDARGFQRAHGGKEWANGHQRRYAHQGNAADDRIAGQSGRQNRAHGAFRTSQRPAGPLPFPAPGGSEIGRSSGPAGGGRG